jgi:hypothetical protein
MLKVNAKTSLEEVLYSLLVNVINVTDEPHVPIGLRGYITWNITLIKKLLSMYKFYSSTKATEKSGLVFKSIASWIPRSKIIAK